MKKASISILKARLSQYLDAVKGGEDVLVTERGRPVARITSVDQEGMVTGRAVQLVREGRMRAPMRQRPEETEPAPGPSDVQGRSLELLLDERAESRDAITLMRFWDSSAVIPLLLEQPMSERARALLAEDPDVVIWWGTPIECASALAQLRREGLLTEAQETEASRSMEKLRVGSFEMVPGDQVRAQAIRVLRLHPLRAADSLQLAAALEWAGTPSVGTLVTFDARLASAAEREGFSVLGTR